MATYADNGTFRAALRTPNTNIITDANMLNTTVALEKLTSVPYHLQATKLDKDLTVVRLAYNAVH